MNKLFYALFLGTLLSGGAIAKNKQDTSVSVVTTMTEDQAVVIGNLSKMRDQAQIMLKNSQNFATGDRQKIEDQYQKAAIDANALIEEMKACIAGGGNCAKSMQAQVENLSKDVKDLSMNYARIEDASLQESAVIVQAATAIIPIAYDLLMNLIKSVKGTDPHSVDFLIKQLDDLKWPDVKTA